MARRLMMGLAVALALAGAWTPAHAADYYVNWQGGADTFTGLASTPQGGATGPWKTIAKANATAMPGDVIHVMEGTYAEGIQPNNAGSGANARITFIAEGKVTLEGSYCLPKSWTVIDGFDIIRGSYGFYIPGGSNIHIRNCRLFNNSYGITGSAASSVTVERCTVANNTYQGIDLGAATTIDHSTIVYNGYHGATLGGGGNAVRNSILAYNGYSGLYMSSTSSSDFNDFFGNSPAYGSNYGGWLDGGHDVRVDPGFDSASGQYYMLKATSPLLGLGSDGSAIGARGKSLVSASDAGGWTSWVDGNGIAAGSASSDIQLDVSGNLMLKDSVRSGRVLSPVYTTGSGQALVTINFDAIEDRNPPSGLRMRIDYDTSTPQSEVRYRAALTSFSQTDPTPAWQVINRSQRIFAAGSFIQVEYTLRRDGY